MALWRHRIGRLTFLKSRIRRETKSATATSDELPAGYRQGLTEKNLVALWPLMRSALPHDKPDRRTVPCVWRYRDIRPDMVKAADIAPITRPMRSMSASR